METLAEYDEAVKTLTPFQKRVLKAIERAPNEMANTWEICWNDFAKEWNAKRSGHGALFRCILQAGQAMQDKGIIAILPPRDEHDTYTFSSHRKWYAVREQQRAQQSVEPTGGESAANLSLFPAEANPPAKVTRQSARR